MTALLPATETLDLAARDGVLHVTLARPEVRNAMSARMVKELQAVLAAVADDRSARRSWPPRRRSPPGTTTTSA